MNSWKLDTDTAEVMWNAEASTYVFSMSGRVYRDTPRGEEMSYLEQTHFRQLVTAVMHSRLEDLCMPAPDDSEPSGPRNQTPCLDSVCSIIENEFQRLPQEVIEPEIGSKYHHRFLIEYGLQLTVPDPSRAGGIKNFLSMRSRLRVRDWTCVVCPTINSDPRTKRLEIIVPDTLTSRTFRHHKKTSLHGGSGGNIRTFINDALESSCAAGVDLRARPGHAPLSVCKEFESKLVDYENGKTPPSNEDISGTEIDKSMIAYRNVPAGWTTVITGINVQPPSPNPTRPDERPSNRLRELWLKPSGLCAPAQMYRVLPLRAPTLTFQVVRGEMYPETVIVRTSAIVNTVTESGAVICKRLSPDFAADEASHLRDKFQKILFPDNPNHRLVLETMTEADRRHWGAKFSNYWGDSVYWNAWTTSFKDLDPNDTEPERSYDRRIAGVGAFPGLTIQVVTTPEPLLSLVDPQERLELNIQGG